MTKTYALNQNALLTIEQDTFTFQQGRSSFFYVIILAALIPAGFFSYYVWQQEMPYLITIPLLALLASVLIAIVSKRVILDKRRGIVSIEWLLFDQYTIYTSSSPFEIKHIYLLHETDVLRNEDGYDRVHQYYYLMNGNKKLCGLGTKDTFEELRQLLILEGDQPLPVKKS